MGSETLSDRVRAAAAAGIDYLAKTQHAYGSWTDFWLPVGTSDAWVTAYVGLSLQDVSTCGLLTSKSRRTAERCARLAADWLGRLDRPMRGWGYNASVPPDADSTAHALSLLARTGHTVPKDALDFLREHRARGEGFRTYRWRESTHAWREPCADVSAAGIRALHDVGELDGAGLLAMWNEMLAPKQDSQGWWSGFWWTTPNYPTGLALEVWRTAGCPPLTYPVEWEMPSGCAFDLAWALQARAHALPSDCSGLLARLVDLQERDGAWPRAPILRVPSAHGSPWGILTEDRALTSCDARRLFTTASAIRALAAAARGLPKARRAVAVGYGHCSPPSRSEMGRRMDDLVSAAARALGFHPGSIRQARDIFWRLTSESLSDPCPWPTAQLSSLAGGSPLEFSVTAGREARAALRYAVEVGDPFAPPYRRAESAVAAIARTSEDLGLQGSWQRIAPAVRTLVTTGLPVPDGLRFWVWGGVDQVQGRAGEPPPAPVLKIYLNLLHGEAGPARERVDAALRTLTVPVVKQTRLMLDLLDEAGFPQEIGFGLTAGLRAMCKVYYELRGWRRSLVERLLRIAGLPPRVEVLCPEIPGIIRESLAACSRAGISFRIDLESGTATEITTTAAFPLPLIGHRETSRRVASWIEQQGWSAAPYLSLSGLLLPAWEEAEGMSGTMHSLFTRTLSRRGPSATVYLRPFIRLGSQSPPVSTNCRVYQRNC